MNTALVYICIRQIIGHQHGCPQFVVTQHGGRQILQTCTKEDNLSPELMRWYYYIIVEIDVWKVERKSYNGFRTISTRNFRLEILYRWCVQYTVRRALYLHLSKFETDFHDITCMRLRQEKEIIPFRLATRVHEITVKYVALSPNELQFLLARRIVSFLTFCVCDSAK